MERDSSIHHPSKINGKNSLIEMIFEEPLNHMIPTGLPAASIGVTKKQKSNTS